VCVCVTYSMPTFTYVWQPYDGGSLGEQ